MLTLYQVLSGWGKTLHFKWRERLGIEPGNPITITAFTGQRDHIVTKLIFNKTFHCFNLPHPHFFTKKWVDELYYRESDRNILTKSPDK